VPVLVLVWTELGPVTLVVIDAAVTRVSEYRPE
jgi:hypothetical protein